MTETGVVTARRVEDLFPAPEPAEKASVISHGVALRLSDLLGRRCLPESKMRHSREMVQTGLEKPDAAGLPDRTADEMHEGYLMCHHWAELLEEMEEHIACLERIGEFGILNGS